MCIYTDEHACTHTHTLIFFKKSSSRHCGDQVSPSVAVFGFLTHCSSRHGKEKATPCFILFQINDIDVSLETKSCRRTHRQEGVPPPGPFQHRSSGHTAVRARQIQFSFAKAGHQLTQKAKVAGTPVWQKAVVFIFLNAFLCPPRSTSDEFFKEI